MGSQFYLDPKFAAILGHRLDVDQMRIMYWTERIASVSLGAAATSPVELGGGGVYGTSADYQLPTAARCIVAVRPKLVGTTPTANEPALATLQVTSKDLHMGDFEVFANPLDSGLGTTEMQYQDPAPWYPLMQPCYGGEKMQFYGTPQLANTVAHLMSVDVLLADAWPEGYDGNNRSWMPGYNVVQAKIAGINSGGGPTSTGTAASSTATDGGLTISAPWKRLLGLYGVVVGTTPAASKPISGWFEVVATELAINPQSWCAEPITGFLGTTTAAALAHISSIAPLNMLFKTQSTPKGKFHLDQGITTLGKFEVGYIYMDKS